jgi:hypothetical protein
MQKKFALKQEVLFSSIALFPYVHTLAPCLAACPILTNLVLRVCHDKRHLLSTFNLMHLILVNHLVDAQILYF